MENRKVQMGSINLYSGYKEKGEAELGGHANTSAFLLPSHPAVSREKGFFCGVGMSFTLTLPPSSLPFILSGRTGRMYHSSG